MSIRRVFLGLELPALLSAAAYLLDCYRRHAELDLRDVLVVLPGRRACRRLLEVLVDASEQAGCLLTPPTMETVGSLPERLYVARRTFAEPVVQELAWSRALRHVSPERLQALIPDPPSENDEERWLQLGRTLRAQHVELAAAGLSFRDVARQGGTLAEFPENRRWEAMADVQDAYHRLLDELRLWDRQTARLVAIKQRECQTKHEIILIGAVDMYKSMRQMLDQIAHQTTALIFAPQAWEDRFDRHGCLLPGPWRETHIAIADERIEVVGGPNDQARAVGRHLAALGERFGADEITIGIPDETLVPDVSRVLDAGHVSTRWGPGRPINESGPCTLLSALSEYVSGDRFQSFAALVRHPDLQKWLAEQGVSGDCLRQLDDYSLRHLPQRVSSRWLGPASATAHLRAAQARINKLARPLASAAQDCRLWGPPLLELLGQVYGSRELDRDNASDRLTIRALELIREVLGKVTRIPEQLAPEFTASRVIRWTLEQLRAESVPPPADLQSIEMLGWLELALDDTPALIVTSLNEGFVPESANSDLFLPNRFRQQLGLFDNDNRYARDAYALSVMLGSRETVHLIVGRYNHDGDPLIPSRLLFATDGETATRRAIRFFETPPEPRSGSFHRGETTKESRLAIPRPLPLAEPLARVRVTSFRDYIACPYRFYLRHVLKLEAIDDRCDELDGAAFGSLAHEVLRRFGESSLRDSTDPAAIRQLLHNELDDCVSTQYRDQVMAVVPVQVEQLRLRLNAFADAQAEWASGGWRIEYAEALAPDQEAVLVVDDEPIALGGRIDRIDVNERSGERVVFDYKTGDNPKRPREAHQQGGNWIDLQLPLYRHLARSMGISTPVQLGYILLPKDASRVEFHVAKWSEEELEEADAKASEIVRAIRREVFWPPQDPPPKFFEELASICWDQVLGRNRRA